MASDNNPFENSGKMLIVGIFRQLINTKRTNILLENFFQSHIKFWNYLFPLIAFEIVI